ncbi:MAG: hypothetical protein ACJAYY_001101 [Paraglaciecola sp.]
MAKLITIESPKNILGEAGKTYNKKQLKGNHNQKSKDLNFINFKNY